MKKDVLCEWSEACQNAFESIKKYLLKLPKLGPPIEEKPCIFYITAQERSIGSLRAQENKRKKKKRSDS